ncbi:hypothetical protein B296_00018351 [Ensete ventricosum]|uniref:Uncharacterized protein n=1 Tax=Ensete ventricosum TaxID=4639 RepID=A0A426ZVK9_ENSVE|nr:hypothetical protein B296_00018351 [Ensete ventricosum]
MAGGVVITGAEPWEFWRSWKVMELFEIDTGDSSRDLDLASNTSPAAGHWKLPPLLVISVEHETDAGIIGPPVLAVFHQLPRRSFFCFSSFTGTATRERVKEKGGVRINEVPLGQSRREAATDAGPARAHACQRVKSDESDAPQNPNPRVPNGTMYRQKL